MKYFILSLRKEPLFNKLSFNVDFIKLFNC